MLLSKFIFSKQEVHSTGIRTPIFPTIDIATGLAKSAASSFQLTLRFIKAPQLIPSVSILSIYLQPFFISLYSL